MSNHPHRHKAREHSHECGWGIYQAVGCRGHWVAESRRSPSIWLSWYGTSVVSDTHTHTHTVNHKFSPLDFCLGRSLALFNITCWFTFLPSSILHLKWQLVCFVNCHCVTMFCVGLCLPVSTAPAPKQVWYPSFAFSCYAFHFREWNVFCCCFF